MKLQIDKHKLILVILFFIYVAYFVTTCFLRYDNFHTGKLDLGNMDQTVWNTIHGRFFEMSNEDGIIMSRLAAHADFLLILISPLYLFWSDPRMLLLIQVIVVAAGSFFVYAISQEILKNKNLSLVLSFAFLINPAIERANLYDFHAVTLATTFLLATFYFYLKKKYKYFLLFAFISAFCKEQIWIIIALFGIFIFLQQKKRLFGAIVFFISAGMFYFLIWYLIPKFAGAQHFALSYYSDFGESPTKVVLSIVTSPRKLIDIIAQPDRINYLVKLFLPQGALSLFSPLYLVFAFPDLMINLLSSKSLFRELYYHYTATVSPFIFISTIYSIFWLKQKLRKVSANLFVVYIILFSLLAAYFYGPLPGAIKQDVGMYANIIPDQKFINNYLAEISSTYSIAATNDVGSHIAERRKVYIIPSPSYDKADLVIFLKTDWEGKQLLLKIKNNPDYKLILEKGNFFVFKKKSLLYDQGFY